jgi:uncharacterized membrane protein YbhN (UPF0104 family)
MLKNVPIFALKLAVTAGLIYWFVLPGIDFDTVIDRMDRLSPGLLLIAGALIFFQNAFVVAWRWERVVAAIDRALPPWRLLKATIITLFFNQVLPSTIGGDGMRIWFLRGMGRTIGVAIRSVVIDRLIGFFGLLLLGLLGSLYLMARLEDAGPVWVVAMVSLGGLILIVLAPALVGAMERLPFDRLRQGFETLAREVNLLARDRPRLARLVGASILGQLALAGAVYCLARDLEVPLDLLSAFAVVPGVMVAASVPISIAGWGVREATMVVGLGLLGVGQSDAAIISIGFGVLVLIFGLLGGLVWVVRGSPKPKSDDIKELDAAMQGGSDG